MLTLAGDKQGARRRSSIENAEGDLSDDSFLIITVKIPASVFDVQITSNSLKKYDEGYEGIIVAFYNNGRSTSFRSCQLSFLKDDGRNLFC